MTGAGAFRRRAAYEARRYGGDPWVFVRELLQNARDAGATRVELEVERSDGRDRVVCRDDGCGMTLGHARRYLFTLYATSKERDHDTAGRFGIGFWAVLRFSPDEIAVRSRVVDGAPWELRLSGDLERLETGSAGITDGTEIELVRRSTGPDPVAEVVRAVTRDARHIRQRGTADEILEVLVNGRPLTREIDLEPPSLELRSRGRRAVVALADEPRVDLLAHGLRVRTAATLDELLTEPERRRRRRRGPTAAVAPRIVLDSRRLQVLMARGDARSDRELRRLVELGRRGVRRLVRDQLDRGSGLGPIARFAERGLELVRLPAVAWSAAAVAVVAVVLLLGWWVGSDRRSGSGLAGPSTSPRASSVDLAPEAVLGPEVVDRYRGPAVDPFPRRPTALDLRYSPVSEAPLFVVFTVRDMDDNGRVVPRPTVPAEAAYVGAPCSDRCLDIGLRLRSAAAAVRLPVPTGHLMDPSSLTIVGGSARLLAAPGGVPQLVFAQPGPVEIRYRTGPGRGTVSMGSARWPTLSGEAAAFADGLRGTGVERAANRAEAWVRQRVAYDTSGDVVRRHRSAIGEGLSFSDRCLLIGAGDCDVQNTLLGAILDRAGVEVRLAVGFVGAAGRALPGLHAWIEVLGDDRRWAAFDASRGGRGGIRRDPPDAVPRDVRAGRDPEPASAPPRVTVPGAVRSWWIVAVLVVVAAATGIWIHGRVRVHRVCRTDAADLSALLRGALDRPDAYREVPALFTRRVVPLLTGGAVSLARARALAAAGRLGVARSGSDVTRGAARRGWRVLDGNDIAAEEVAAALGAIDLDRWMGIADAGRSTPLTDAVERAAAGVGERWRIIVSRDPPDEVVVVELPGGERLIAIDPAGLLWLAVSGLMPGRPSAAGLILADELLDRVPVAAGRAQRLRSRLAAAALVETWGDAE